MNKRVILLIFSIIVLVVAISGIIIVNKINKNKEEDKLYNKLNQVVKEYYKDYYYNTLGSNDDIRKTNAEKLRYTGIKMNLYDLSKYKEDSNEILSQFKNSHTKANCDYYQTTIVIYPTDPYGREDIRIDSNIVCGL